MRRAILAMAPLLALTAAAHGDGAAPPAVIGGADAIAGKWPDIAAVLYPTSTGDKSKCTGTLVAPTVVLTAGHCADASDAMPADHALIGTSSLARPGDGETLEIARRVAFPDALETEDIAVLVLAQPSTRPPRPIATGWARLDIANGAEVALVGFGAVDRDGMQFVDALQEAHTTITDFDCRAADGCNTAAQPAGELGAGGMGIDTCRGDSGGPLYLITSYGAFLAGVTSRAYQHAMFDCSEGGIYGRPDKVIDWIESVAGVPVSHGPEPAVDPLVVAQRDVAVTQIRVNDPKTDAHTFAITAQPAHGFAAVDSDGTVHMCSYNSPLGDDELTVAIADAHNARRTLSVAVKIQVTDGGPPTPCDYHELETDTGGCCDSGGRGSAGAVALAIAVIALARRRRSPRR
jgi:secreted trypsin-like serine protease